MSGTEATPLMGGRALGSNPRVPSELGEEEDDEKEYVRGQRLLQSAQAQAHRPRSWTSSRLFWTLPGFGLAVAAGFISATQTIELFRQPSQQQQQQQQQQQGGAGGAVSSVSGLAANTVHESSGPSARLDVFSGAEGVVGSAQQDPDRISTTPTTAVDFSADTNANGPDGSGSSRHGLGSEGQTARADVSEEGVDAGVGGEGTDGIGAMRSDGLGTRSGGGWRSNGAAKNSGTCCCW